MIKQIITDENDTVTAAAFGNGYLSGGIDVEDIPSEVIECPQKWKYSKGKFIENEDYTEEISVPEITVDDLAAAIAELAEVIANG